MAGAILVHRHDNHHKAHLMSLLFVYIERILKLPI